MSRREHIDWRQGMVAGAGRLRGCVELLNAINVFPVADGDTGVNLAATVAPLQGDGNGQPWKALTRDLLLSARGNSGNLMSRFIGGLLEALEGESADLGEAAQRGRDWAYDAVHRPVQGTILTVMDELCRRPEVRVVTGDRDAVSRLLAALRETVQQTPQALPVLREAGVVDAGALGLLFFLEGFFYGIHGLEVPGEARDEWQGLSVRTDWLSGFWAHEEGRYCVDLALRRKGNGKAATARALERFGSVEVLEDGDLLKVHLHTDDLAAVRDWARELGDEVAWHHEDMDAQRVEFRRRHGLEEFVQPVRETDDRERWKPAGTAVHVLTDAAGSLTREVAEELRISLNHSYIFLDGQMVPECDVEPERLYDRLKRDHEPVTTAQASEADLVERLERLCAEHEAVLYLAVGRQYTGNQEVVRRWKEAHDSEDRLRILDTAAASGQLGLVARAVAEKAQTGADPDALLAYAESKIASCKEYVFLGTLKYLARSGRMSKVGAFFGNAFKVKPVVVHRRDGAGKAAVVRSREAGLAFAVDRAREHFARNRVGQPRALLQHTDAPTREWLEAEAAPALAAAVPDLEILWTSMSCTAGTHMGPGTWAVAYLRA